MKKFFEVGGYSQWIEDTGEWNCTCIFGSNWRWSKKSIEENKKCVHIKLALKQENEKTN